VASTIAEPLTEGAGPALEPARVLCPGCGAVVLAVEVSGEPILASAFEWEPKARCYLCSKVESRVRDCPRCRGAGCVACDFTGTAGHQRAECKHCGGAGFVGRQRPRARMLAVDVAWSDEGHVRIVGPKTARKKGEALYELHRCLSFETALSLTLVPERKAA
jgi:hypothetical protein